VDCQASRRMARVSMKTLITSDWHLHPWREFATTQVPSPQLLKLLPELGSRPTNSRLLDGLDVGAQMLNFAEQHNVGRVIHGGDLVHRQGAVPTEALVGASVLLRAFKHNTLCVIFNPGNHDHADRSGEYHTLQVLSQGGLAKISDARGYRIYAETSNGRALVTFDYCDDAKLLERRIDRACKTLRTGEAVALFHHGFKGARVGSLLEYVVKEPLDANALGLSQRFKRIFSGHYHARQPIVGCTNGMYIGAPAEMTRSDVHGIVPGFLIYDDVADTVEVVPTKAPRFVQLGQADLDKGDLREAAGNFCDVTYHEYRGGPDALRKLLTDAGALGVNLLPAAKPEKARAGSARVGTSPDKLLRRYVKAKTGRHDKELLRLGRELLTEATQNEED